MAVLMVGREPGLVMPFANQIEKSWVNPPLFCCNHLLLGGEEVFAMLFRLSRQLCRRQISFVQHQHIGQIDLILKCFRTESLR